MAAIILLVLALVFVLVGLWFLVRKRVWRALAALILAVSMAAVGLAVLKPSDCSEVTLAAMGKLCRAGDHAVCERVRTRLVRCGLDVPSDLPRP
jgi:hypothetical protein